MPHIKIGTKQVAKLIKRGSLPVLCLVFFEPDKFQLVEQTLILCARHNVKTILLSTQQRELLTAPIHVKVLNVIAVMHFDKESELLRQLQGFSAKCSYNVQMLVDPTKLLPTKIEQYTILKLPEEK